MNIPRRFLGFAVLCCLSAPMVSAQAASAPTANGSSSGTELFQHRCSGCHGIDGEAHTHAGTSFHALDFHDPAVMKMTDADLAAIIHDGKNRMPAFGNRLSQSDIESLVAYIHTLQKK